MTPGWFPVAGGWEIEHERGPAALLHEKSAMSTRVAGGAGRLIRVLDAERSSIVLGSGQPRGIVDDVAAETWGVDVVRRNSGGGAVLVGPGQVAWVDLLIPTGDPLWDDDVGRAAWWVGDAWAAALDSVGCQASVWKGALIRREWSAELCFAGLGPGEVTVEGRKVVGIAQRRTRTAALFQTAVLLTWQPRCQLRLLTVGRAMGEAARGIAADLLQERAQGLGAERGPQLVSAFTRALMP